MIKASKEFLRELENLYESRKREIRNTPDKASESYSGCVYYVSADGNDQNDGLTREGAWATLDRVSAADLQDGDAVLFRRGDLFRGSVQTCAGVTYGAYGSGGKPRLYGSSCSLADKALWELYDEEHHIWRTKDLYLDAGTLVFNDGEEISQKLIPSYKNRHFVCRDDENRDFDVRREMKKDLDLFWEYDARLTEKPSNGEKFPIPLLDRDSKGYLYLRCDRGNPGEVFDSIESLARVHMFAVKGNKNVHIDNLCIKYVGMHGVSANRHSVGLKVTNCEFGYIGGCLQHYFGTDPNYPQGGRGTVTRFGNAVEVYGGCENYEVSGNYIYEVYDAGITHQITTEKKVIMADIRYTDNLIEKCVYGIEYFLNQINGERESCMEHVVICNNWIRLSGYGWGQQRHNKNTPAHIKGWSYVNTAKDFTIRHNIFDRSAYRMLHLVALKNEYCPSMSENTYIQHLGGILGQYGGNEEKEPELLLFDDRTDSHLAEVFGDINARVYSMEA